MSLFIPWEDSGGGGIIPDGHVGTGNGRQLDGARETLVTLGVVVLQTDLKLDGLEEVSLLLILRVVEQLLDVLAHSGCSLISISLSYTYTYCFHCWGKEATYRL